VPTGWQGEPAFASSLAAAARAGSADPLDCLICVPPDRIETADGRRRARIADAFVHAGFSCWDACDSSARDLVPESREVWRIVPYDSCRGLEGWITVAWDLDAFYARRKERPHMQASDSGSPELVAGRWLMTVLTRSVHTLVVILRDPSSELAAILRAAAERMPKGVVEWVGGKGPLAVFENRHIRHGE
jgi:hypothetical protein